MLAACQRWHDFDDVALTALLGSDPSELTDLRLCRRSVAALRAEYRGGHRGSRRAQAGRAGYACRRLLTVCALDLIQKKTPLGLVVVGSSACGPHVCVPDKAAPLNPISGA